VSRPTYPFDVKSRDVWSIAVPASIAFITEPLVGMVDITVIGRLGDAALLGGLVLGALVFDFIFSLAYFLRLGTAGLTAQAIGARDPYDGLMHVSRAILLGVAVGAAMIALQVPLLWLATTLLSADAGVADALSGYFKVRIWAAPFSLVNYALLGWFFGRANARTGLLLQMLIHGVDTVLSIAFVYSFGMGVGGAALATVIGQMAAAAVGLTLLTRHYGGLRAMFSHIEATHLFDAQALKRMFGLSRDLMIRSAALMCAYAYFAAQGSKAGEITLGANAILLNLFMVTGYFLDGLAQASEQLCGKAVGANYRPAFERAVILSMRWGLVIATCLSVVFFVAGNYVVAFMTTNEAVRAMAHDYMPLAALGALTGFAAFVIDGVLTGSTLNTVMRNGMLASLALFLAAAFVLQPLLGNTGLWIALHVFFLARGVIYWFALERRKAGLFTA
jgi:MATE family multidrug resistance protein